MRWRCQLTCSSIHSWAWDFAGSVTETGICGAGCAARFLLGWAVASGRGCRAGGRIRHFAWIGAGIGIAVALLATALDFAWRGWPFLAGTFVTGLLFYPYIGMIFGFNFSLRPGDPKPSIRNFRFRMQTLMILVTYLGILCGLGTVASRYSTVAIQYQAKALNSQTMVDVFQTVLERARADLKRAERAKELRADASPTACSPPSKRF